MHPNVLLWFSDDLRLSDNGALRLAARQGRRLLCIYCLDPRLFVTDQYATRPLGPQRWWFLRVSLEALDRALRARGQRLHLLLGEPSLVIAQLIPQLDIDAVYRSQPNAPEDRDAWERLRSSFPFLPFHAIPGGELLSEHRLPFALETLPSRFEDFRRAVEPQRTIPPRPAPRHLPPPVTVSFAVPGLPPCPEPEQVLFQGGEAAALKQLNAYFASDAPRRYPTAPEDREDFASSTRLSPWLANGCLSPRQVMDALENYEARHGADDTSAAIRLALLKREYLRWYARRHGANLYAFTGIGSRRPLTSFYPQRFAQWCQGQTPWPLLNACMAELNTTGYLSERCRQIAASFLVNELQLDWRIGARYFQQQLVDHDPALNWGNWQAIAGVGAEAVTESRPSPTPHTGSSLRQQRYLKRWCTAPPTAAIDTLDAADWPIFPDP